VARLNSARGVVVTGMGAICALGDRPAAIYHALCEGRSGFGAPTVLPPEVAGGRQVGEVRDFTPANYVGDRNVRLLDRTGRLSVVGVGLALADGGWPEQKPAEPPIGAIVGTMFSGVRTIGEFDRRAQSAGPEYASPLDFSNTVLNAAAGQVAIWYRLKGVNSTIAAGPVSGLHAIAYAAEQIRAGRAGVLVAGGVEELCFESFQGFLAAGLLAGPPGAGPRSVPFGTRRSGVVLGEGAAFLVLEAEEVARARGARIVGRIHGSASGFDPAASSGSGSNGDALARTIERALGNSGVSAASVSAVAASASGSRAQDACEARGIRATIGSGTPVMAIKSMLGETLGASGALNAIAVLESLCAGRLPGIPGLAERDPEVDLAISPDAVAITGPLALVTAVAAEGNCGALVLGLAQ
jgi:3-oxoacyl-[acyl-carrier-protein] synthase II